MKTLWHDIQTHQRAAVWFLAYLLVASAFPDTKAGSVLLFTTPLIAGALVGWWRASTPERVARWGDRIRGGMLAGALIGGITFLRMAAAEAIGWIGGHRFQTDEVLGSSIFLVVFGILLGLAGAVLAIILDRLRHPGWPASSS